MLKAAGYIRLGPGYPLDAEAQEAAIRRMAEREGVTLGPILRDGPGRGLLGRDALLRGAGQGIPAVIVTSACRLAPTFPGLLRVLTALRATGTRVLLAAPNGDAVATLDALMAGLPALEAAREATRREAVARGRERARARGVRFGRPPVPDAKAERARAALAEGVGVRAAARLAGVSPTTAHRIKMQIALAGCPQEATRQNSVPG